MQHMEHEVAPETRRRRYDKGYTRRTCSQMKAMGAPSYKSLSFPEMVESARVRTR